MKRIIGLVYLALVFAAGSPSLMAQSMTVGSASGLPGDTVIVPVSFTAGGIPIGSFDVEVIFDNTNFSAASIDCSTTAIGQYGNACNGSLALGKFRMGSSGDGLNAFTSGLAFNLSFTIANDATPGIKALDITHFDYPGFGTSCGTPFGADISPCPIALNDGNVTVDYPSSAGGYVVIIDGYDPLTISPSFTTYLYNEIDPDWFERINLKIGKIWPFPWSGDTSDNEAVTDLSATLEILSGIAKQNKKPLVVLAHSWGSVLAYAAVSLNGNIEVRKLITFGSPLDAQDLGIHEYTKLRLGSLGIDANPISRPRNVGSWINYWSDCDEISGPIQKRVKAGRDSTKLVDASGIKNLEFDDSGGLFPCHSAYYLEDYFWDTILLDAYLTK